MKLNEEDIVRKLKQAQPRVMPPKGYEAQLLNSLHHRLGLPPRKTFAQKMTDWMSRPSMGWAVAGAFCLAFVVSVMFQSFDSKQVEVANQSQSGQNEVLGIAVDENTREIFVASLEDSSASSARDIAAVSRLSEAALNQVFTEMGERLEK